MDRDRLLQELSVRRITRVIEVHWSEPQVLAGILHELRFRLEPEAGFQARSIARRLSTLQYHLSQDAARMAVESQAAAAALTAAGAVPDEPRAPAEPPRRRRRAAVIALVVAAAVAAAWLLRPRPDAADEAPPAKPGLALAARGTPHATEQDDVSRRSGAPTGDDGARDDANEPPHLPASAVPSSDARGAGGAVRSGEPGPDGRRANIRPDASLAATGPDVLRAAPVVNPADNQPERLRPEIVRDPPDDLRPEAGIQISEPAVECFLTNPNPDGCAVILGSPAVGDHAVKARGILERSREGADAVGTAPSPPRAALPVGPGTPAPAQCTAPARGTIVFVLDASLSMGLPLGVEPGVEDQLDAAILRHDAAARQKYRALLAEAGPKRITRAREAFGAAVNDLPDPVKVGLVVFQECKDIRSLGTFEAQRRGRAIDYIRALIPHGRTPIAASLRAAAGMLGDGPSSIVLLTDGRESCSGDPCAAAADIHAAHPDTPIHVVDLTGQAKAECVADVTGGNVYTPAADDDLAEVLRDAFRSTDASCPGGQD